MNTYRPYNIGYVLEYIYAALRVHWQIYTLEATAMKKQPPWHSQQTFSVKKPYLHFFGYRQRIKIKDGIYCFPFTNEQKTGLFLYNLK